MSLTFLYMGKLHMNPVNIEPMTSSSNLLSQMEEVPFELKLTGQKISYFTFIIVLIYFYK